jgi:hypothetical protein
MTLSKGKKHSDDAAKATTPARKHVRVEDGLTTVSDATLTYRPKTRGTDDSVGMSVCIVGRETNRATIGSWSEARLPVEVQLRGGKS